MSFLKFICHRNDLVDEENVTPRNSNVSANEQLGNAHQTQMEADEQQHPIVARYVSLLSPKKRFRVGNLFRRVEPKKLDLSDSQTTSTYSSQISLQPLKYSSTELLTWPKSSVFPLMSQQKTISNNFNLSRASCPDISENQATCSNVLKRSVKADKSDACIRKFKGNLLEKRHEYLSSPSLSETRDRALTENNQRSSRQILMNLLAFPKDIFLEHSKEKSSKRKTARSSRKLSIRRSRRKRNRKSPSKQEEIPVESYLSTTSANLTHWPTNIEVSVSPEKSEPEVIDVNRRSVFVLTEQLEEEEEDLPSCVCPHTANSCNSDIRNSFLNYMREYYAFLAKEVSSFACSKTGPGTVRKEDDKGEEESIETNKSTGSFTATVSLFILCTSLLLAKTNCLYLQLIGLML